MIALGRGDRNANLIDQVGKAFATKVWTFPQGENINCIYDTCCIQRTYAECFFWPQIKLTHFVKINIEIHVYSMKYFNQNLFCDIIFHMFIQMFLYKD